MADHRDKEKIYKFGERFSGTKTKSGEPQDYDAILERCLKRQELFEDPEFPCAKETAWGTSKPEFEVIWKRPWEISKNPEFLKRGFSRFDVQQGGMGDCWVVASMATLTLHSELFKNVVPQDQTFAKEKYAGIFHFRLWKANRWIDIVIDDRLPYNKEAESLAFISSKSSNEFWSALLEKAYAKLHGGYAALSGGSGNEALGTFTGGLTEQLMLERPPKNLFRTIQKSLERNSLITCSILQEERAVQGLHALHEYSVTGTTEINVQGKNVRLIRVRNPWGSGEWTGAWSDKSKEWTQVSEEKRKEVGLVIKEDGEFWISEEDFIKSYQMLDFCHLDPGSTIGELKEGGSKKRWETAKFEGSWMPGVNAGGSDTDDMEKFACNPQYMVTLHEPDDEDEDGECTVIVALIQKNRRVFESRDDMWLPIGFALYEVEDPEKCPTPLSAEYLGDYREVCQSERLSYSRENTTRFRLLPGTFCVIPFTGEAEQAGDFLLRIYTEKKCKCREHDEEPAVNKPPKPEKKMEEIEDKVGAGRVEVRMKKEEKEGDDEDDEDFELPEPIKDAFEKVASEDGTVCCNTLQAFLKELTELIDEPLEFSLDTCRSMVALVDQDYTGTLGWEEFSKLFILVIAWQEAFKEHDKEKKGYLSTYALRKALRSAGYHVNQHVLKALILRYGHDRKISMMDFIGCAVKLMCMIDIYEAWDPENENEVTVTRNEWLKYTMYC
uniref:Calpain catalytic domain-containing protein n=1 Tax=Amblyomma maculatum TaxID=34609 RepID=G3MR51_AMBMU